MRHLAAAHHHSARAVHEHCGLGVGSGLAWSPFARAHYAGFVPGGIGDSCAALESRAAGRVRKLECNVLEHYIMNEAVLRGFARHAQQLAKPGHRILEARLAGRLAGTRNVQNLLRAAVVEPFARRIQRGWHVLDVVRGGGGPAVPLRERAPLRAHNAVLEAKHDAARGVPLVVHYDMGELQRLGRRCGERREVAIARRKLHARDIAAERSLLRRLGHEEARIGMARALRASSVHEKMLEPKRAPF